MEMDNDTLAWEMAWQVIPPQLVGQTEVSEGQVHLWALVLAARFLPCRIEVDDSGWQLAVPTFSFARSLNELRLFEEENRNWPPYTAPESSLSDSALPALSFLFLLATFHNLTLLDLPLYGIHAPSDWFAIGDAHAAKIMDGQWWRLVTALTLHVDWPHLLNNVAVGGVIIIALCRVIGSGLALSLLLNAGVIGNLANVFFQTSGHRSVGASTLVFGGIGVLSCLNAARFRYRRPGRWFLSVAAGLALLTLLGTEGQQTDIGAHMFGFLSGAAIGLPAGYLTEKYGYPSRRLDNILLLASAAALIVSWLKALMPEG